MTFTQFERLRNLNTLKKNFISLQHGSLFFILLTLLLFYTCTAKIESSHDFKFLVFSQRWLPSSCIEYREQNSLENRSCILPNNYTFWAVHGLWPTTEMHKLGPFFCNTSMKFDENELQPIESTLKAVWPNIEDHRSFYSLWEHEWNKHGTCAVVLEPLNSIIKYFSRTLALYQQYNMNTLFLKNKVFPSNIVGYNTLDIFNLVKENIGKTPSLHCIIEKKTNQPYISEIRVCLNKTLELIDCQSHSHSKPSLKNLYGNCPLDKQIFLPENVDSNLVYYFSEEKLKALHHYEKLNDILQIIRFLQWSFL